jgi:nitrous oxide reductase accessory protein NosL
MKKSLLIASLFALALAGCQKKEEAKPAEAPKA